MATGACTKTVGQLPRVLLLRAARRVRRSELRLDAREQLARRERLDQVIVGAGLEPLDAGPPRRRGPRA